MVCHATQRAVTTVTSSNVKAVIRCSNFFGIHWHCTLRNRQCSILVLKSTVYSYSTWPPSESCLHLAVSTFPSASDGGNFFDTLLFDSSTVYIKRQMMLPDILIGIIRSYCPTGHAAYRNWPGATQGNPITITISTIDA